MIDGKSGPILIATSNRGKFAEFRALLPESWTLLSLQDVTVQLPPESGTTFAAIAASKALGAAEQSGFLTVGDDSGLCVDALAGKPGIRSARYAGEPATDKENRNALLYHMAQIPHEQRAAKFICALAFARPGKLLAEATGECHGTIGYAPSGANGFGYDPIFVLKDNRPLAELTSAEKNQISHRASACQRIMPMMQRYLEIMPREGSQ